MILPSSPDGLADTHSQIISELHIFLLVSSIGYMFSPRISAPPFALLPLVTRELDTWLGGSEDRVAVLHCKGVLHYLLSSCIAFELNTIK